MKKDLYTMYISGDKIYLTYIQKFNEVAGIYYIDDPYLPHKVIRRSFFYTFIGGFMYGDDKDKLLSKWNEYHKQQAGYMKIKMLQHESYIAHSDDNDFIVVDRPSYLKSCNI